jgi:hypothetical protein
VSFSTEISGAKHGAGFEVEVLTNGDDGGGGGDCDDAEVLLGNIYIWITSPDTALSKDRQLTSD